MHRVVRVDHTVASEQSNPDHVMPATATNLSLHCHFRLTPTIQYTNITRHLHTSFLLSPTISISICHRSLIPCHSLEVPTITPNHTPQSPKAVAQTLAG
jgi:hypothetical protein